MASLTDGRWFPTRMTDASAWQAARREDTYNQASFEKKHICDAKYCPGHIRCFYKRDRKISTFTKTQEQDFQKFLLSNSISRAWTFCCTSKEQYISFFGTYWVKFFFFALLFNFNTFFSDVRVKNFNHEKKIWRKNDNQ